MRMPLAFSVIALIGLSLPLVPAVAQDQPPQAKAEQPGAPSEGGKQGGGSPGSTGPNTSGQAAPKPATSGPGNTSKSGGGQTGWKKGGKYDGSGKVVTDYGRYQLTAPPNGQHWVRDGNDFILVSTINGLISSIIDATNDR